MKKTLYWIFLLTFLFTIPSFSWAIPPQPARIGGSVNIDEVFLTAETDSGYTFEVKKEDGTAIDPVASDTDGLTGNDVYIIDIPIYEATDQPGGVNPGDTVVIHVYYGDTELLVTTPENGEITVGASATNTTENIVAYTPKTLTIEASDNGSTDPAAGSHYYEHGISVPIEAIPDSGYVFSSWTGDVANSSSASTTITMDADQIVSANFSQCFYTLTMMVNDSQMGAITVPESGTGDSSRACDSAVNITATPEDGYFFTGWTGDVEDPAKATTTVTMDDDKTITANFAAATYTLTVESTSNGTISLDPPSTGNVYGEGAVVSVTATPASGYLFSSWTGELANAASSTTTITMDRDKTIGAAFVQCTKTLTMAVNDSQMGGTSPAVGENTQSCDETVTITATPESGYSFVNWAGDVANQNLATTTVLMDTSKEVTANFTATTHILTVGEDDHGRWTLSPAAEGNEYAEGAVVTITAVPFPGWAFSSWTGDVAEPYLASTTVTVDQDKTVAPVFLVDVDGDGKDDTAEQGPDGTDTAYDGNGDGTADSAQANVVSGKNGDGTYYITIATDEGNRLRVVPISNPDTDNSPSSVNLDYGFFDIKVSNLAAGGATTVTIILPDDAPAPDTYYKYGPTPDDTTPHWYEFLYDEDSGTGAEFDENIITLYFVDGSRGDSDLNAANGIIDDPGAPGMINNDNCFIATAAYGSIMEPHVKLLRDFRDRYMLTNGAGKIFVEMYYKYSPNIATYIADHDSLRAVVRYGLLPAVGASWMILNFGFLFTISVAGFIFLMIFSFYKYQEEE